MKQSIETLLEKYYEGETTLAEEKELRQYFQQDTIPAHLISHAAQFRFFAETRSQHPSAAFNNELARKLMTTEPTGLRRLTSWVVRLAASVTLLLLGFAGGRFYDQWRSSTPASETLASQEAPALEIKKVLAFEQTPRTSASERIQAVNQSYGLAQADRDITQLLINTMNFDANINVRLAACQALTHFDDEPSVREALIQSLTIQTDPNMQLTLIDILVTMKEKRAVDEMQRLAQNRDVLDVVRQKAEEGITRLVQSGKSPS